MPSEKRIFKKGILKGANGQCYPFTDLSNEKIGRLTVISIDGRDNNRHLMWKCVCDCGNTKTIAGTSLIEGYTISCGCYYKEVVGKTGIKHGKCKTKLYYVYRGMIGRCYGKDKKYARYKGRIFVCDRWLESFRNFYDDMFSSYQEGLQLDRINNNGDYKPDNCRWATPQVQSNNKSNNRFYTINDKSYSLRQLENIYGTNRTTILSRLKRGWDIKKAVGGEQVTDIKQISQYLVF